MLHGHSQTASSGTLAAQMIRAGHDITLCDADEAHIAAIREHGLIIEGPVNEFTVAVHDAATFDDSAAERCRS